MSDAEVLVSDGAESNAGTYIFRRLPSWMPTADHTGNFKLLDVVARAIDRLDGDIQDVDNAVTVQHAESIPQLEQLAKLVALPPNEGEPREKYRSRVIADFQTLTSEGTPTDLIENAATILDVNPTSIGYRKLSENGAVELAVPGSALDSLALSDQEFVTIIGNHAAAGFRVEATVKGTFTYITPTDYSNNDHDPSKGYDGLDSNGDPKNNGGTYAGIIE